jgi:hypothetical protein
VGPLHERGDFVLVHVLQRNRIDLDLKACIPGCFDAAQDLVEITPARDGAEFFGIERIERDIDALDAMSFEFGRKSLQL